MKQTWQLNTVLPNNKGIIFVAYHNDSLIYWSDNTISFDQFTANEIKDKRFDYISNGWYVIKPYTADTIRAYGLILVKTQYPYENDYLVNGFQPDLKLPTSTELLTESQPGSYAVHDWEGIYLFSIRFSINELRFSGIEHVVSPLLYLCVFVSLLMLLHTFLKRIIKVRTRIILLLVSAVIFIIIRWL
ncbi:MAG: hypothetical protein H6Q23_2385, partial [Bacteroidetes bacterium]|nr:hypothetical protein [Bacteroidota bacterium]